MTDLCDTILEKHTIHNECHLDEVRVVVMPRANLRQRIGKGQRGRPYPGLGLHPRM